MPAEIPAPATSTVRGAVPHSRAPVALSHHSPRGSQGSFTSLLPGSCMRPPPGPGLLGTYLHPAHTLGSQNKQMQPHGRSDTREYSPNTDRLSQICSWLSAGWSFSSHSFSLLMCPAQREQECRSPCSPAPAQPGDGGLCSQRESRQRGRLLPEDQAEIHLPKVRVKLWVFSSPTSASGGSVCTPAAFTRATNNLDLM